MLPLRPLLRRRASALSRAIHQSAHPGAADPSSVSKGLSTIDQDSVSTLIVGGGAVGTSLAYHLAKKGAKNVVLAEKTELTAGSTWHAAGLTTYYHPVPNLKQFHYYSLNLFKQLEAETGQAVGLHTPGSIRLLHDEERIQEAHHMMTRHHWHPAPQKFISPDEVAKMHPLVNMDGIKGGLYSSGDGHIDPYSLTMALAKGARMYGAKLLENCRVDSINKMEDGRWEVTTSQGVLKADHVVNASGFWGKEIGRMVGVEHPLTTVEHQYFITESIPEVQALETELPVIRDLHGSYYCRQERDGLLFGMYESADKMKVRRDWQKHGVPPGFGKELYESDLDRIYDHMMIAMDRVPVLANAGIQNVTCGPICYTPDVLPIVGPVPHQHNYWVANGFAYGIAHSGGVGDYLSDWILNGYPPYENLECDPARYGEWCTADYVAEKARESYGDNTLVMHPHQEKFAGRPARTTGAYHRQLERGAQMGCHNGWEQPHWFALEGDKAGYYPSFQRTNWFEPVRRECEAVMNNVGILDLSPFSKYKVKGPGARVFLERMCANTMPKLGRTNISHVLMPNGRVLAEFTISRTAVNEFYIITGSGVELHDLRWLESHMPKEGVTITNVTDDYGVLSVVGPRARELLEKLTLSDVSDEGFPFMTCQTLDVGPARTLAIRVSYTGELGWEFHTKASSMAALYDALLEAGKDMDVKDVGTYAMNSLRLEKGFRMWGHEMNKDTTPLEAGLEFFIKPKKKTEFIGKEAFLKDKPRKRVVMLSIDTDEVNTDASGDETVWLGDKVVGWTCSGAYGFTVNKSIAFAKVPVDMTEPGTKFQVELQGKKCAAVVENEPLVETEVKRKRAEMQPATEVAQA